MPNQSQKQLLTELGLFMLADNMTDSKESLLSEDEILIFLSCIEGSRRAISTPSIPKSTHWFKMVFSNDDFDEGRFRSQFRMERQSFYDLFKLLADSSNYNETQEPIPLQVAVALYHLGSFGNSSSFHHIATKFGVSEGSVENFTRRTIDALCKLSSTWISWPNKDERSKIGLQMAESFLPKCIAFIDGTDVELADAPLENKEVYWSRKKKYCMQTQIICDPELIIRDLFVGYPGSVHDAKVYASSPVGVCSSRFFSSGEFMIGDSAYPLSETVITPFRRHSGLLDKKHKLFNTHISSRRVAVENCIGILKGRFQSLLGLRVRVDKEEGHKKACKWIQACVVLHNMLMKKDRWMEQIENCQVEDEEGGETNYSSRNLGENKRAALVEVVNVMLASS